jgi:predicted DNA-binding protein with PD1-like motif
VAKPRAESGAPRVVARGGRAGPVVVVRLARGDRLLESLREICRRERIRNGVILTGFGSLSEARVTGVVTPSYPPTRFYERRSGAGVEILALSGVVADYHIHAHVVLSDRRAAFGGHLEEGCRVLSLSEVAILRLDRLRLKRVLDPTTGQKLLTVVRRYREVGVDQEGSLLTVQRRLSDRRRARRR